MLSLSVSEPNCYSFVTLNHSFQSVFECVSSSLYFLMHLRAFLSLGHVKVHKGLKTQHARFGSLSQNHQS